MLNNNFTKAEVLQLRDILTEALTENRDSLIKQNIVITNDTDEAIKQDYTEALDTLLLIESNYQATDYLNRKAKGNILLILSYNEPFVMNIAPVLSALVAGNTVHVRPSSAAMTFFKLVWQPVMDRIPQIKSRLHIVEDNHETTMNLIPSLQAVYLFGSQHVAKKIAVQCAEHLVEFWPETEGADVAVIDEVSEDTLETLAAYCLDASYTHAGQICQRIQGVYVQSSMYDLFVSYLSKRYRDLKTDDFSSYVRLPASSTQKKQYETYCKDIERSSGKTTGLIEKEYAPLLITNSDPTSKLCHTAYFLPALWICEYTSHDELMDVLAARPIQFGINIWTASGSLVDLISRQQRYTRITHNTDHIHIRGDEGWGGSQPTSYGGYISWVNKFTNRFTVINSPIL